MDKLNWVTVSIFGWGAGMLLFAFYKHWADGRSGRIENPQRLKGYATGQTTHNTPKILAQADHIYEGRVDEIRLMTDIKEKGDALEDFTRDLYRLKGYTAFTVRELRAKGKLQGLTGTDQGADVIAELFVKDPLSGKQVCKDRIIIQCKAYKNLDEDSGNSSIQQVHTAKDYYLKWYDRFDKAVMITTSPRITIPAQDLAKQLGVEIYNGQGLKMLVRQIKSKMTQETLMKN